MHAMAFHTGVTETILFEGWKTNSWQGIVGSMIGIGLLAALYEALKSYREHLYIANAPTNPLKEKEQKTKSTREYLLSGVHFLQTFLHAVQYVLGYFLMLIFMTYNIWLCLAMVIGATLGYWFFSWEKFNPDVSGCCD
ncbi:high affinity copper uptake protein 1 [Orussus abietinus]|uniref:high affinity copper uptake protein 1 n=1 Tax=Orussus abietinus TaxID=222816 RepID=UPI000626A8B9|nr:high affinity copper uptake protein 1 [Orussus abietinus]